jgi:Protein of unknown function (DUF3040)
MVLSEGEQRRLGDMERALQRDDPKFAARVSLGYVRGRRLVAAAAVFLVGVVVLFTGLVLSSAATVIGVIVSIAGLLGMVAAAFMVLFRPRWRRRG